MHKKNAVVLEKWLLLGDWYIHPDFKKDKEALKRVRPFSTVYRPPYYNMGRKLAHKCQDGKIGRIIGYGINKSKRKGLYKIYGRCYYCKAPVCEEIHTLINMLEVL